MLNNKEQLICVQDNQTISPKISIMPSEQNAKISLVFLSMIRPCNQAISRVGLYTIDYFRRILIMINTFEYSNSLGISLMG